MIKFGPNSISSIYFGDERIAEVYVGNKKVWPYDPNEGVYFGKGQINDIYIPSGFVDSPIEYSSLSSCFSCLNGKVLTYDSNHAYWMSEYSPLSTHVGCTCWYDHDHGWSDFIPADRIGVSFYKNEWIISFLSGAN